MEVFAAFGPEEELQLFGRGLRRRLPTMLGGDPRRIRMVYSLMFSLPGTPVLFYGEEIGMGENLAIEGRMSVRSPMQWSAAPNGGFSAVEDPGALCRPVTEGEFGPEARHQLYGRGLRRRLPSMVDGDQDRVRLAYSLAFSLPGTPVLFYGEEIGMRENLEIEGRYSVRSPMQWSSERHRGFTTGDEPCRPLAPGDAEVAAQRRDPGSLLNWMERLIRRRRECPELGWGRMTLLDAGDPAVLAHRADWDGGVVLAVHLLAEEPRTVRIDVGDAEAVVDLFGPDELTPAEGSVSVALGRYGHRWFRVRCPGQRVAP